MAGPGVCATGASVDAMALTRPRRKRTLVEQLERGREKAVIGDASRQLQSTGGFSRGKGVARSRSRVRAAREEGARRPKGLRREAQTREGQRGGDGPGRVAGYDDRKRLRQGIEEAALGGDAAAGD